MSGNHPTQSRLRYQADDGIPLPLALGLGVQLTALVVAVPILIPTAVMRAGGADEAHMTWVVFASVAICGITTILQACRIGRIGAGHVIVMSSAAAFIGLAIDAIDRGGAALLVTLVVVAALLQFVLSARLALFRRILTPAVSGTAGPGHGHGGHLRNAGPGARRESRARRTADRDGHGARHRPHRAQVGGGAAPVGAAPRRLRLVAYRDRAGAVLEFAAAQGDDNIQDRLAVLGDPGDDASPGHDVSLRLLKHLASSVRHQQYHDVDIVTVHVKVAAEAEVSARGEG